MLREEEGCDMNIIISLIICVAYIFGKLLFMVYCSVLRMYDIVAIADTTRLSYHFLAILSTFRVSTLIDPGFNF